MESNLNSDDSTSLSVPKESSSTHHQRQCYPILQGLPFLLKKIESGFPPNLCIENGRSNLNLDPVEDDPHPFLGLNSQHKVEIEGV